MKIFNSNIVQAFSAALALSVASLFLLAVPSVSAATITWSGIGIDANMSNDENWEGYIAPGSGDTVVFPAGVSNRTVNNDLSTSTTFVAINFTGTATLDGNYTISGNSFGLTNGFNLTMTGTGGSSFDDPIVQNVSAPVRAEVIQTWTMNSKNTLKHTGDLTGSGVSEITKTGNGDLFLNGNKSEYFGQLVISAGNLYASAGSNAFGDSSSKVKVESGATFGLSGFTSDQTFNRPLDLTGDGTTPTLRLAQAFDGTSDPTEPPYPTMTFTGDVLLGGSNIKVLLTKKNATFTGTIATYSGGPYHIILDPESVGTLETPAVTINYEDDEPGTDIIVSKTQTAVVTGTYGNVDVLEGGILKGTGTVGNVEIFSGGTIAPGLSPGCLSTGDLTFNEGGIYDFELGGTTACTQYDQIKVTGSVTLGNGTLNTLLINDFKPTSGQSFTIIANDGSDAVNGTFKDLAEGATLEVDGVVYKISYVGGDGNDVVLTVTGVDSESTPSAPDTGFALIMANPIVTFLITLSASAMLYAIARRQLSLKGKN
ncbi:hypothetical protein BH23PAT2_BH23PAT2_02820 [soil metagenome]